MNRPTVLSHRPERKRFVKKILLPPAAGVFLAYASCTEPTPQPPPPPGTDTEPVGEGLKMLGYALLGAAVVGVIGRMIC